MSSFHEVRAAGLAAALLCWALVPVQAAERFPGVGRDATPREVAAWDIDVRPDFKGLPKGAGTVEKGMDIWEGKCASCHGVFGESNEVFSPLIGGTTAEDIRTGHAARLKDPAFPGRTTFMKVATLSTLWDYVHRAMPWNAPKSLSADEVYAVTAYMLNLAGVVPQDFTLSDANIAEVQKKMPNRNGMDTRHALWPGKAFAAAARPDVQARACMSDCGPEPQVRSALPEHAGNNHGNLADQNRTVGAQRGVATAGAGAKPAAPAPKAGAATSATVPQALLDRNGCTACHGMEQKIVGPALADIARKYTGQAAYLGERIRAGSSGVWGNIPMPPQALSPEDAQAIAQWLAARP